MLATTYADVLLTHASEASCGAKCAASGEILALVEAHKDSDFSGSI
jgi:hypothetical protein